MVVPIHCVIYGRAMPSHCSVPTYTWTIATLPFKDPLVVLSLFENYNTTSRILQTNGWKGFPSKEWLRGKKRNKYMNSQEQFSAIYLGRLHFNISQERSLASHPSVSLSSPTLSGPSLIHPLRNQLLSLEDTIYS